MAKLVRAQVKGELLVWARNSAGLSLSAVAKRLKVKPEAIADWEGNSAAPTVGQLQRLADIYKRPLAVFFLAEPPRSFMPMRDFRRMPGKGLRAMSYELALEIRLAHQQRLLAIDLAEESGEKLPQVAFRASLSDDPEKVGRHVRELLEASPDDRARWASDQAGYSALNTWRARIEKLGVLVFQAHRVSAGEVSGFAIAESPLPAIAVSRADSPRRRTFSLLHEFAHVALRLSGVSEVDVDAARPPEEQAVEIFCNRVASAALLPRDLFLAERTISGHQSGPESWSDEEINSLSQRYGVSREVVVRRMLTFNLTTQRFYSAKRTQYRKEFETSRQQKKVQMRMSNKPFATNPPREALTNLGEPLVRRILESYYQERMSLSDVSSYLGIRARHVTTIEGMVGGP